MMLIVAEWDDIDISGSWQVTSVPFKLSIITGLINKLEDSGKVRGGEITEKLNKLVENSKSDCAHAYRSLTHI